MTHFISPCFFLGINPFFSAYDQSDYFGKGVIISLILLSIVGWIVLVHKIWVIRLVRQRSQQFHDVFQEKRQHPLSLSVEGSLFMSSNEIPNPYVEVYHILKTYTLEMLNKNRAFGQAEGNALPAKKVYLSSSDVDLVSSHMMSAICTQTKKLEKNLFVLLTMVSLAPFLGLLGTVWGILISFSGLQSQAVGGTNQLVLAGLSTALATTVLGLVVAIPALIGYNYLKAVINNYETEITGFSVLMLASVEMQYRKVDVS